MPIYPDRKNGKLTGRFRVEATRGSAKKRGRANSLPEAKALEKSFIRELETGTPAPVIRIAQKVLGTSLAEARRKADGLLWAGQSTEVRSFQKLDRILSLWGDTVIVDDIDANKVDELITFLRGEECSEATINRYLSCVSKFLRWCKERGHRRRELPAIDWRTEDEGRIRWLTYQEEARLLKLLPEPYRTLVYIDIRTGLRASELLGVEEDQVTPKAIHLWKTKNNTARTVPISEEIYRLLKPLIGSMPTYWQLHAEWEKARKAMGLVEDPTFVFHACRHTYATRAIEAGVNIRVLQRLMGHKAIQTTLRYAHVADSTLASAVEKMYAYHDRGGAMAVGR